MKKLKHSMNYLKRYLNKIIINKKYMYLLNIINISFTIFCYEVCKCFLKANKNVKYFLFSIT